MASSKTTQKEYLPANQTNFNVSQQGAYDQLNNYFNEKDLQQKTVLEAREILGDSADSISDQELYELVTEMQYLVDVWIEDYEKSVFDGKTLKELLLTEK
jgi:hypothetical protein